MCGCVTEGSRGGGEEGSFSVDCRSPPRELALRLRPAGRGACLMATAKQLSSVCTNLASSSANLPRMRRYPRARGYGRRLSMPGVDCLPRRIRVAVAAVRGGDGLWVRAWLVQCSMRLVVVDE